MSERTAIVRALIEGFDTNTLNDIANATLDQAVMFRSIDRHHPDPALRASASRLDSAHALFAEAASVSVLNLDIDP